MNSVKLQNRIDAIFINHKNSEIYDSHILLLNLTDKINLKGSGRYVALSNLSVYYTWKKTKNHTKIINLKNQLQHEMKNSNYMMDHILYQIFKIILNISKKTRRKD